MNQVEVREYALMEGNLLEYPVFSMERRRVSATREVFEWKDKNPVGEVTKRQKFTVNCNYGIPNAFDLDVFNAIMRIYVKKKGSYQKNEVHFTVYELAKELNLALGGSKKKRIKESLIRMSHTNLMFEHTFYIEKERITRKVDLITQFEYYEKQRKGRLVNVVKVVLDESVVNSIDRKYYKLIDFDVYKSLSSGIPRRLYEYLEKKKYRKTKFEIGIRNLAKRVGLKTHKPSQLKKLFEKANDELQERGIIDKWEYRSGNVIYRFRKSERFKEVEDDLFHLESLTVTFYESLGHKKVSESLRREGMVVLQDLLDEGYRKEEVTHALGWAVDNIKGVHSIRILPKVIGQALGDKESKHLLKERKQADQQKRLKEIQNIEKERRRGEELDKVFKKLSKKERERIEQEARENLIEQGTPPKFISSTLLRVERNRVLEEERGIVTTALQKSET